jgi:hypothetical protein
LQNWKKVLRILKEDRQHCEEIPVLHLDGGLVADEVEQQLVVGYLLLFALNVIYNKKNDFVELLLVFILFVFF